LELAATKRQSDGRLLEYEAEMSLSRNERDDTMAKLESIETRCTDYSQRLREKDEHLEQYRLETGLLKEELAVETGLLKEELASIRDQGMSQSTNAEREIRQMEKRMSELQLELAATKRQSDDGTARLEAETRTLESRTCDYDRVKMELNRQNAITERMSRELESVKDERNQGEEKISSMQSALGNFQSETKRKVDKVVQHERDSVHLLERALRENRALASSKKELEAIAKKLQRERDACYDSLEIGRERLAKMASKSYGRINGDSTLGPAPEVPTRGINGEGTSHIITPELYLTDYSVDHIMNLRAEEIAACLAVSAKKSVRESHEETYHLRSQVFKLEEAKEAEVSSLKARIRSLERELVQEAPERAMDHERRSRHRSSIDPDY
jgi:hypothetical protein